MNDCRFRRFIAHACRRGSSSLASVTPVVNSSLGNFKFYSTYCVGTHFLCRMLVNNCTVLCCRTVCGRDNRNTLSSRLHYIASWDDDDDDDRSPHCILITSLIDKHLQTCKSELHSMVCVNRISQHRIQSALYQHDVCRILICMCWHGFT